MADNPRYMQQSDYTTTGAFNSADIYVCAITVPFSHRLRAAWVKFSNVVTAGTVTATLRYVDPNNTYTGGQLGAVLTSADLGDHTNTQKMYGFDLTGDTIAQATGPAYRTYFVCLSATDASDRLDRPELILHLSDTTN